MDLYFADGALAKVCASTKLLARKFGTVRAKRVSLRLAQLGACQNLADMALLTSRIHALGADRAGQVAVDLDGPCQLIIEQFETPNTADGSEEDHCESVRVREWTWARMNAVLVVEITDYH